MQGEIVNCNALDWYLKNFNRRDFFPSDDLQLPSLKNFKTQSEVCMSHKQSKNFEIVSGNNDGIQPWTSKNYAPKPRNKFEIQELSPAYSPIEKKKPSINVVECLSSDFRGTHKEDSHVLYLKKQAVDGI